MKSQQTHFLSQNEREAGLHNYQIFSFWNGLGFSFLSTSIVSLLAIQFGASNLQLGYISSAVHFAGIVLIFIPRLLNGFRIKKVYFLVWVLRGAVCYLYAILFFLDGQQAVYWILILFTLFAIFRSIGVPMGQPLLKSIIGRSGEGDVVVKIHTQATVSQLLSQIVSFLLLSLHFMSGLTGLIALTWIGATSNTAAAHYLNKIPSRERVLYRKGKNIFIILIETLRHKVRGRIFTVRLLNLAGDILIAFSLVFLRKAVGMPANMVFVYSICGAVAAIVATRSLRPFVESIGSRPLIIISAFLLGILLLVWTFISAELSWAVYYVIGFVTLFFFRIRFLLMSRLLIKTLPENDKISYTAMLNFVSAIVGICIGLLGGALADLSLALKWPVFHAYSLTFFFGAVFTLGGAIIAMKIRDPGSLSIKETASVFLSAKNIRAYLDIYQLETTTSAHRRETTLLSLEQSNTPIATEQIRSLLHSPKSWEIERILRSLYAYPRHELLDEIIAEAKDHYSYNRLNAIFTLGAYPHRKTRKMLSLLLQEDDPAVVAAALKSLGRLGDNRHIEKVYQILRSGNVNGRAEIDCIHALCLMDEDGLFLQDIFQFTPSEKGSRFQQLGFVICSRCLALEPPLSDFFFAENSYWGNGFSELIEEAREVRPFDQKHRDLYVQYVDKQFDSIWKWCSGTLSSYERAISSNNGKIANLKIAIMDKNPNVFDPTNTIAAVYFTYQLIRGMNKSDLK